MQRGGRERKRGWRGKKEGEERKAGKGEGKTDKGVEGMVNGKTWLERNGKEKGERHPLHHVSLSLLFIYIQEMTEYHTSAVCWSIINPYA